MSSKYTRTQEDSGKWVEKKKKVKQMKNNLKLFLAIFQVFPQTQKFFIFGSHNILLSYR